MRPFSLLIKPTGSDCNLACEYCFYRDKADAIGAGPYRMSDRVLEAMIRDYLSLRLDVSMFCWQGGEPTVMGLDFYRRAVDLQADLGTGGQSVSNSIQTNGVLLDDAWCEFLSNYRFLVGLSIDGPREIHDAVRTDKSGAGSFDKVMRSVELCNKHGVLWNALSVLHAGNVQHVDQIFDFFIDLGAEHVQFIPMIEGDTDRHITADQYGEFLVRFFDRWLAEAADRLHVRLFDAIGNMLMGAPSGVCYFQRRCDSYLVVEHNGDVFCCDFFVTPDHRVGNVTETSLRNLMRSPAKKDFAAAKEKLDTRCQLCRWLQYCRGGCPAMQQNGRSTYCTAYRRFFEHAVPKLRTHFAQIM